MSLKDKWKDTGINIGHTAAGLGKAIVKSVKVGAEKALDETPTDENGNEVPTGLREEWTRVGRSFGKTGRSLGQAAAGTAKKVADAIEEEDQTPGADGSGNG